MTTKTTELPDWLHAGAKLAIIRNAGRSWQVTSTVTVERILARDIVLNTGERFNRNNLSRPDRDSVYKSSSNSWVSRSYLVRCDDPRVIEAEELRRDDVAVSKVAGAYEHWWRDRSSSTTLDALVVAARELQELRAAKEPE